MYPEIEPQDVRQQSLRIIDIGNEGDTETVRWIRQEYIKHHVLRLDLEMNDVDPPVLAICEKRVRKLIT